MSYNQHMYLHRNPFSFLLSFVLHFLPISSFTPAFYLPLYITVSNPTLNASTTATYIPPHPIVATIAAFPSTNRHSTSRTITFLLSSASTPAASNGLITADVVLPCGGEQFPKGEGATATVREEGEEVLVFSSASLLMMVAENEEADTREEEKAEEAAEEETGAAATASENGMEAVVVLSSVPFLAMVAFDKEEEEDAEAEGDGEEEEEEVEGETGAAATVREDGTEAVVVFSSASFFVMVALDKEEAEAETEAWATFREDGIEEVGVFSSASFLIVVAEEEAEREEEEEGEREGEEAEAEMAEAETGATAMLTEEGVEKVLFFSSRFFLVMVAEEWKDEEEKEEEAATAL